MQPNPKPQWAILAATLSVLTVAIWSLLAVPATPVDHFTANPNAAPNVLLQSVRSVTWPSPVAVVSDPIPDPVPVTVPAPTPPVVPSAPVVVPTAPAPPVTVPVPAPVVKPSFLVEAQSQIGQVNPPYDNGGDDWCYLFVNFVGDNSNTPGWVDAQSPGTFSNPVDPNGPQPGDIAQYDDTQQAAGGNEYVVHVGIVETVDAATGTFVAIEGNGVSSTTVVETTRPISGDGPEGYQVLDFLLP